jgi:transcriptional regulator with XRE-family HTH domain
MRQNQLAKVIELDETALSKMINGFREPSPRVREQIARILESDEAWLFQPASNPGFAGESKQEK